MKRREFIKKTGLATAGAITVPYILPSGRLFAASGLRKVNHVVFCLFAGGVRNLESVQMKDGNLMPNMLSGPENISLDIVTSMDQLPTRLPNSLQTVGSLFKDFKYLIGPTGHFNGHTTAITGAYTTADLNIKEHPRTPTVFEFYRKHNSPAASARKCWWVSNTLGPYPALNFSSYGDYGAQYGANFIAPTSLISGQGYNAIGKLKNFTSNEEATISKIKTFVNHNFNHAYTNGDAGITNTDADAADMQSWITNLLNQYHTSPQPYNPWGISPAKKFNTPPMNNDMLNIFFAEEIIKRYKPELLVVNMQDVDIGHFEFTEYCNNLRKADYSVAHLWNTIQSTPDMMNDTVMIVVPEHGRNYEENSHIDVNGRKALDHTASMNNTGDQMARDIFCLVVGPSHVVKQNMVFNSSNFIYGDSIEVVPAIANLLGFDSEIPSGLLKPYTNCDLQAAFV